MPGLTKTKKAKKKPTILVVHGWSLNPATKDRWQPLIKLLTKQGHQVKYLDMPGFEKPLDKPWGLNDYVNWLLPFVKKAGPCVIIGHSFGGQIACKTASLQPENLKGLVLIGPAGVVDRAWNKVLKRQLFQTLAKIGKKITPSKLQKQAEKGLYFLARERDYYQAPPFLKQTMSQVVQDEILNDLPKISVPTIIFWGKRDDFTPVKHAPLFNQRIVDSQLMIIPDAGHCPHYYLSEMIAEEINKFFKKTKII